MHIDQSGAVCVCVCVCVGTCIRFTAVSKWIMDFIDKE